MQYTASSFEFFATRVLPRWLPTSSSDRAPRGLYCRRGPRFVSRESDPVTQKTWEPLLRQLADRLGATLFQQGVFRCICSTLVAVVLGFGWISVRAEPERPIAPPMSTAHPTAPSKAKGNIGDTRHDKMMR